VLIDAQPVGAMIATVVIADSTSSPLVGTPTVAVADSARKLSYQTLPRRCLAA
jgi:hypothetical protein